MSKRYEKSKAVTKLIKRAKVLFRYVLDPGVKIWKKALVICALVYIFSPLDLIPEIVLGLGIVDDLVLFVFLISMISDELDRYIKEDEELVDKSKYSKVIEVDFSQVNDDTDSE